MDTTRLRLRRIFRRRKRQFEGTYEQTEEQLDKLFFRRLTRLGDVRRFVGAWILLVVILIGGVALQVRGLSKQYQTLQPVSGGTFTEGIVGSFTNANPLYATSVVDETVAKLVFASLLTYDSNNQLVGDLAKSWSTDERNVVYTVNLKPNLKWHDGRDLTAEDVVFTYQIAQNPDAKSPFLTSWQGVKIEALNKDTVIFTLPSALSSFPQSLTNGIVPKHLLEGIPITSLRSISFNTSNPVGSGPFKWQSIEVTGNTVDEREQRVGLVVNKDYVRGVPRLDQYVIRTFRDEKRLEDAFKSKELTAVVDAESIADGLPEHHEIFEYGLPLTSSVMIFLNTSRENLIDIKVRQALVQATDINNLLDGIGHPVITVNSPLLRGQIGYDRTAVQLAYNTDAANKLLDEAGWIRSDNGIRAKNGRLLTIRLFSQSIGEYANITSSLQKQWERVGVKLEPILQPGDDLQSSTIAHHEYDALLYGISIGPDPDVYAFWHSSQADIRSQTRLNLSEYKSGAADRALEGGRTRSDPALRAIKYKPFLDAWRVDAPAIGLYQPRFLYLSHSEIFGLSAKTLNTPADRLNNVYNWMIRLEKNNK